MNLLPRLHRGLDRTIGVLLGSASILVLPVSLLLFLQWPLRDLLHAYAREANDIAQWLFALYVSAAVTYATRVDVHPAAHALAHHYPAHVRRLLRRAAALLVLLPWSVFMLVVAWPVMWQSVMLLEAFPETYDPGYFLVKVAAWLFALLVFLQALLELLPAPEERDT